MGYCTNKELWNKLKGKIIVPLAFGAPSELPQNRVIANHARELSENTRLIMAQLDVAYTDRNVIPIYKTTTERHITTLQIAELIKGACLKIDSELRHQINWPLSAVQLVAAPQHLERAIRDFRKVGFCVEIAALTRQFLEQYPCSFWYNWNSTQWCTKHPCFWWPRELMLRILPWPVYKFITG